MAGKIDVVTLCRFCGVTHTVTVKANDYRRYKMGSHAQHCFPYLSDDERELLISGTCKECWEKLFPTEDEEDTSDVV